MKKITAHSFRLLLSGLFFMLMCTPSFVYSQTLTISSTGETETSGINWNTSGTNPVTITATGGSANVNTSVIIGYLNNGISVIVHNNNLSGNVVLTSDLTKSAGGDATLTLRADKQAVVSAPITSTSSKINVILWSDYNNSNVGGVALSAAAVINTNGGHFWAGGSSSPAGSYTWNGLTVGDGPSVGSDGANNYAMDLFTSQINTNNGHILLWSGTGYGSVFGGIGMQNNPHLNAGSGNVTLITRQIFNANNTLSVTTTGKLALATDASNPWTSDFNWATTTSGSNVTLTSTLGQPLQINNFSTLGGLSLGVYDGFGTSFNYTNLQNVNINSSINIPGPITVYGGDIAVNENLNTTAGNANGDVLLKSAATISIAASKSIITNGGNITFWADNDANGTGGIKVDDNVTIDSRTNTDRTGNAHTTGGGKITFAGGLDDGGTASGTSLLTTGLVSNDGFPDGYAVNSGSGSSTTPNTGIVLGTIPTTPAGHNSNINIFSGSGDIRFNGLVTNNTGATVNDPTGLLFFHGYTINGGTSGNVILLGNSSVTSANGCIGMDLAAWRENSYTADGIVRTVNGSINVVGRASGGTSHNLAIAIDATNTNGIKRNIFAATGSGSISIDGLATGTSPLDVRLTNVDLLSGSGAITTIARGTSGIHIGGYNIGDGLFIGQKSGSLVESSTSAISLIADNIQLTKPLITNSTGALIFESLSNSFTSNITLTNKITTAHSSLRIGKITNAFNISIGGTTSIAGPITAYGGTISLNTNLTTTNNGDISLYTDNALGGLGVARTINASGSFNYIPRSDFFNAPVTYPISNLNLTSSGLLIGKPTNTADITFANATSIAGPITVYGGDIAINENLNTTAGTTSGNVLIKASGDLKLAANKSITTSGAPVVLWANSDNEATNGSIALRNGSSIVTGSGLVAGGHVWLGGGSDGTTWNGLAVGSGYAVPGTIFTPSNGGGNLQSGIYLERNSISSFGGNIKIAGDGAATTRGIVTYGNTININAGSGEIELDGQVTSTAIGNRGGILFGLHDLSIVSTVNISSSATSGDAITINGVGRGTEDAIGLSGTLNITSSGGGNIVMNGNALGSGRSIVVGNYYHGILNIFANSGNISLNGNTKAVQVAAAITNGLIFGPSKINIGQGGTITSSSSDVFITADNIALAAGGIAINASGKVTIEPASNSFASAITFPITNLSIANTITGLTLGKPTNNQNITFGSATSIAGPITAYGGTISLNTNLTTTNNGDISLYTDNALGGLGVARTINASGSFNYIPRSDFFNAPVTYPISNLNLTSSGLLIGKPTNTADITFANATSIAGPITAYSGTITLDANLTTTNNGDISLHTDYPIAGLGTPRTLTAAGAFNYIPRTTTFSADVTYPIANLTATATGLTIGNLTNDKNITINADVTGGAGIELYGNNVNINANLKTTGTSAIMHLKGNTTIAAGKTITSGGNFTHDGNLTFKSDVNGTAAFGTLGGTFTTVSGLATTERYVPSKRGWRLLTAPLKGATNNTIPANWQGVNDEGLLFFSPSTYQSQAMTGYTTGGGMPNIWKYDSVTTQWQSIPNLTTENLFTSTGNNGFLVFATGPSNSTNIASGATETTLRPEGQLITGNVTHSLTADKYHLIGNPYASPLHTEAMVQANANTKVFMVDPTLGTVGGYVTYDGSNWAPEPPSDSEKYIQSGQGFFVRSASNPTFTISESHKVVGNSNTWFDRASSSANTSSSSSVEADKIRVLLYKQVDSQWQLADGILTVNSATGNNDVDATDTEKMSNFNENIGFRNGTSTLAIEYRGLPTIGTIQPMRLTGTTVQPYQLRVKTENYSNSDLQPYVEDTQTGVLTLIPIDGSEVVVHFTGIAATTTAPDSRFRIVYPATLSSDDPTTSLSVGIYPNPVEDKMFTIVLANQDETTQYTLTNLLGQQVQQGKLDTLQNTVSVASLQGGVYVLQVVQSGKTFTTKLIIK